MEPTVRREVTELDSALPGPWRFYRVGLSWALFPWALFRAYLPAFSSAM
jgi:hypothetical protein